MSTDSGNEESVYDPLIFNPELSGFEIIREAAGSDFQPSFGLDALKGLGQILFPGLLED